MAPSQRIPHDVEVGNDGSSMDHGGGRHPTKGSNVHSMFKYYQTMYREELAEFFGTFIFILFGSGSVAQTILSGNEQGDAFTIRMGYFLGIMFGVYVSGGISGAHLNPAVTIALSIHSGFRWKKVPGFILAQTFGAFLAALVVFWNYKSMILAVGAGRLLVPSADPPSGPGNATAGIFATYPATFPSTTSMVGAISTGTQFLDEFIGSALLMIGIMAIGEARSAVAPKGFGPVMVGLLVLAIGVCFGWQTGFAVNPARDLGPRMASAAVGYGVDVFTAFNYYWWVPVVSPILGAVFGGYMYRFFSNYDDVEDED